jgi:hypothetical protein
MRSLKTLFVLCNAIALCLMGGCRPPVDRTLEETFDETYAVESTATLSVSNRDGSIRVYGAGPEAHEIRVEAIKKAYRPERLKMISVQVSARPDAISIDTIYPTDPAPSFSDQSGTVDYVIVVPQSIRISKLELADGEILVEGTRGDEGHVQLGNGRLFAHNCFGNLDLNVKRGNLAISYEWWEEAEFSIRSNVQQGNSFAYIPSDAAFHLIARSATGKVASDFEEKEQRHAEPENKIDMMVGGGGKTTFQFETQDGNIKISEHNP